MKVVLLALIIIGFGLITTVPAEADPLHMVCTGATVCTSGATTLISSGLSGTFGLINTGQDFSGTAYLIALEPNAASFSGSLTMPATQTNPFSQGGFSSGFLSAFSSSLGLTGNVYQFSSLASASQQVLGAGTTINSFFVSQFTTTLGYSGGNGTSNFANCCSFNLPLGTVVVGFVKDAQGNIINTPLSGSITVPEPASLLLLGAGLAGIGLWRRKAIKV